MATSNSLNQVLRKLDEPRVIAMLAIVFLVFGFGLAWAAESPTLLYARKEFAARKEAYLASPTNSLLTWQFARACFDLGEFATNSEQRASLANSGIQAARALLTSEPDLAVAHYYLGMNLGQLARTKFLGALELVKEMERSFKRAQALDESLDHAGPDRCLGLLYFQAPGWPTSVGSRSKARLHLQRALHLQPDYPENHLNLLEAWMKWGDTKLVREAMAKASNVVTAAKTNLIGEAWLASWEDWDRRWRVLQAKVADLERAGEKTQHRR
jgi:hypothetical protein